MKSPCGLGAGAVVRRRILSFDHFRQSGHTDDPVFIAFESVLELANCLFNILISSL